jgi:hypothetical protein
MIADTFTGFARQHPCLDQRQVGRRSTRHSLDGSMWTEPEPARAANIVERKGTARLVWRWAVNVASPADGGAASAQGHQRLRALGPARASEYECFGR